MKIDWAGFATTKGRPVFSHTLSLNFILARDINYRTGYFIGWDKWSDGSFVTFRVNSSVLRPQLTLAKDQSHVRSL